MRSRCLSVRLPSHIARATKIVRIGNAIIWLRVITVTSSDIPYHNETISSTRCKDS